MRTKHLFVGALLGSVVLGEASAALASSGIDSPENGAVQIGRGSTFVARADDPLAAYYNPGALALSKSGVHVGMNLMFMNRCMTRRDANGQPISPNNGDIPGPGMPGGPTEPTCADTTPFPNPQLAASFRITKNFAVGLAVMGPHGVGMMKWPESLPYTNQSGLATTQPAPQRLLLVESDSLIVNPTLSVSYAINDKLSIGAGFIWGIASISFVNFTEGVSSQTTDDFVNNKEVRSTLKAVDGFIPGFVVGVFSSPHKTLDLGAWFKWQDAVNTRTSLKLESEYWRSGGTPVVKVDPNLVTTDEDAGTLKFRIPLEARMGVRYHYLRKAGSLAPQAQTSKKSRDPLAQDLFDIELDFTYAHNSVVQNLEVRFDKGIPVKGTPGTVPENADIPHHWKDVFGVRLGGDYVVIPGFLALRAGGFFETNGQDPAYLNPDFHLGQRIGIGGGGTIRLGPVDVSLGYQHTFFETLDNGGNGKVPALSGDAVGIFEGVAYRSRHAANGGSLSSSLNEVALGGTFRF